MPFARLIVTRMESTELYVEVPEGFDANELIKSKYAKEIGRIADDMTDDMDWDNSEWEDTVEVQSVSKVSEAEAKQYTCGKLDIEAAEAKPA